MYRSAQKGIGSLWIDVDQGQEAGGRTTTFQSLGVDPRLAVTVANRPRLEMLGGALALTVLLIGLALTNRPAWTRFRWILVVMFAGTIVPLIPGLAEWALPFNLAIFAAAILVPYYLLVGLAGLLVRFLRWLVGLALNRRNRARAASAAATAVLVLLLGCVAGRAEEAVEPVKVPDDAILLPYDPAAKTGIRDAEKMLVPYAKYVDLWNRAYPDKRLEAKAPPVPYAVAGASYTAVLEGKDYLVLDGRLDIDLFAEGFVSIPLALGGGVLSRADLDGKPARLSVAQPQPPTNPQPVPQQAANAVPQQAANSAVQQSANSALMNGGVPLAVYPPVSPQDGQQAARGTPAPPPIQSLVVLNASGKGRHTLQVSVRLKLEHRGGWRAVEGILPSAPASAPGDHRATTADRSPFDPGGRSP